MKHLKKFEDKFTDWSKEQTDYFFKNLENDLEKISRDVNMAFNKYEFLSQEDKEKTIQRIKEFNTYIEQL